ncbi:MAG TPA: prolyl oligopeptidase family serine peptidase [Caulifigura sp.]|nr:prolyl oligopeptidase family serine peptidase [Caulifigura sp.]
MLPTAKSLVPGVLGLLVLTSNAMAETPKPPTTRTIDHVDTYHGVTVKDPYRWLEEDVRTSSEVAAWVEAQNKATFGFLESIPERKAIQERLTKLWNYEKYIGPWKAGGRYFFLKNNGLQNQFVLNVQDTLSSPPRVLLDPNSWSKDGTVAIENTSNSDDGKYMAYAVQDAGSDWRVWKLVEVETGKILPDEIRWTKFNVPSWTADSKSFFYARFAEPKEGEAFQSLNLNQKVYYHRMGEPQSSDVLVYARPDHPDWGFSCDVTEDGRYLVLTVHVGTDDKYRIFYKDLFEPYGMPIELIDNFENEYTFIGNDGQVFYFKTDLDAPRKRVIAIDLRKPQKENWREVLPQQAEPMTGVHLVGNVFCVSSLKDAKSQVTLFTLDGKLVRKVDFPGIGTAGGFFGKRNDTETFYSFSSFATPPSTFRYDVVTGESSLLRRANVDVDPEKFEVKQVFYTSKDGTKIPMFITHKKGMVLDGNQPTLLYGYGGFNIPMTPSFSISRIAWMEMGGVYAVANLRGGGEYGEEWHQGGTKLKKQNVFDDFITAAEWLIANKYTSPKRLAIQGGSNGGLLVGACLTQRPDLFGACLPAVGVMDMLRFQKFTAGRYWVDDYGSSDDPEQFQALHKYSPYHNIKPGTKYPPTLVTTADTDDRVVPGHSFKFAAALQAAQSGEAPTLIRIETRAGHGSGKPTSKAIEETADQLAFLVKVFGMTVK